MSDITDITAHLLAELRARENADNVAGMAGFGISGAGRLGVSVTDIRAIAQEAKRSMGRDGATAHGVALRLWDSAIPEARLMATVLDSPTLVTMDQAERWALDLESWDICDGLCGNLLWRVDFAWELPFAWSSRDETFVKRAGFVMAAQLAVKDKQSEPSRFISLLTLVEHEAIDERNDVKKAVNWALRQIGKRDALCHAAAIAMGEHLLVEYPDSRSARWIARDALRELHSDAVSKRLGLRA